MKILLSSSLTMCKCCIHHIDLFNGSLPENDASFFPDAQDPLLATQYHNLPFLQYVYLLLTLWLATWVKIYSELATFYPGVLFLLMFPIFLILNGQIVYLIWILDKCQPIPYI